MDPLCDLWTSGSTLPIHLDGHRLQFRQSLHPLLDRLISLLSVSHGRPFLPFLFRSLLCPFRCPSPIRRVKACTHKKRDKRDAGLWPVPERWAQSPLRKGGRLLETGIREGVSGTYWTETLPQDRSIRLNWKGNYWGVRMCGWPWILGPVYPSGLFFRWVLVHWLFYGTSAHYWIDSILQRQSLSLSSSFLSPVFYSIRPFSFPSHFVVVIVVLLVVVALTAPSYIYWQERQVLFVFVCLLFYRPTTPSRTETRVIDPLLSHHNHMAYNIILDFFFVPLLPSTGQEQEQSFIFFAPSGCVFIGGIWHVIC